MRMTMTLTSSSNVDMASSEMVPGRPGRRQQQAYRRANTSLNLSTTDFDAYTSGSMTTIPNGMGAIVDSSPSKSRSVKDFLLKRTMSSKDQLNNYVPASTIDAFNSFSSGTTAPYQQPPPPPVMPQPVMPTAVTALPTADSSSVDWSPASTGDDVPVHDEAYFVR